MRTPSELQVLFAQEWVDKSLIIALPSGKSMEEVVLQLLAKAHIKVTRAHMRSCVGTVSGLPCITRVAFCKPSEIPWLVARGDVALGITGTDMVRESGWYEARPLDAKSPLEICTELELSRSTNTKTRCVVVVRDSDPAQSMDDVVNEFGIGGTITSMVTEYPVETASLLYRYGLRGELEATRGSAETLVVLGAFRFGVVLVETGATLKINGLREIATIFESSTVIVANKTLLEIPAAERAVRFFGRTLQGVLSARGKVYLVMNAPTVEIENICRVLPAMKKPTVQPGPDPSQCSIAAVVPVENLVHLKFALESCGASDFVELDPDLVM